jgi:hypothetical protein
MYLYWQTYWGYHQYLGRLLNPCYPVVQPLAGLLPIQRASPKFVTLHSKFVPVSEHLAGDMKSTLTILGCKATVVLVPPTNSLLRSK